MARRRKGLPINGVLLLDKAAGMSSNHALQRARRLYQARKAGHTGTLDPMATGLLPVCFGEATKFSAHLLDADKVYRTRVKLGETTDTGDAEGEILQRRALPDALDRGAVESVLERFRGEIDQVPPMYSALKHQGRKLYELAREGKTIARAPRRVTVYDMRPFGWADDGFWLEVRCSKGTYIRTLAEDIGEALGVGAHINALERLETGPFDSARRISLETLEQMDEPTRLAQLLPADVMLEHLPKLGVSDAVATRLLHGQPVTVPETALEAGAQARLYRDQSFLGLVELTGQCEITPRRLIDTASI
ncbi:tRNA pseudouridine(55) synthase TruB [Salinicola rhizosphaerae]|uniref:tRNA pseudouridine synthase B n=1 Tax=Salinicola rhizosphaerae TaxID=1443141 RepID=A0ABQ3DRI7_9GAMM|nr:tRNA pseudouridine(55) synthase TruB [Salinicola rhizosphaerae]GHB12091.1 tRNA pseudouridine synthase B [Salinicola rhizosphaerae]